MSVPTVNSTGFSYLPGESQPSKLSECLKKETKELHVTAETAPLMASIQNGTVAEKDYAAYLAALNVIYLELERQLVAWGHVECLQPFVSEEFQVIFRAGAVAKDLSFFEGKIPPVEPAVSYGSRLKEIAGKSPHLLIAHAYVRYLGDLFGGQMLKKQVEQLFPKAVAFYEYPQLEHPMRFVRTFKNAMDSWKFDEREIQEIVEEAKWAFAKHIEIFNAIKS